MKCVNLIPFQFKENRDYSYLEILKEVFSEDKVIELDKGFEKLLGISNLVGLKLNYEI